MCRDNCTCAVLFFFNDPATTEIYTLSLHDALPIFTEGCTLDECRELLHDALQEMILAYKSLGMENHGDGR